MPDSTQQNTLQNIILTILAVVVLLVIVWCVYTFIRSILLFVFSASKEENKKKGWNAIRFMLIGVILTVILLFLFPTIFRLMNVPSYDIYTPKNIFNKAGELINQAFKLGDIIKQSQKNNEFRGNLYYDTTPNTDIQPTTSTDYSL